jgi:ABC-type glycerol-3-phosphate transport system substrate-binding protein
MINQKTMCTLSSFLALALMSACEGNGTPSGSSAAPANDAKPAESKIEIAPVTLKVFPDVVVTDDDFKKLFVEPLAQKYPQIKLELLKKANANTLQELLTAGNAPDLILAWQGTVPTFRMLDLVEDMTPLLKKNNLDLNRFDPIILDAVKATADNGEVFGLPYGVNFNALYYNKDIFDKFGVPYPKEGMTWEDAMEVAKKVSREDGGVKYRGLSPENVNRMALPLTTNMSDPATNMSLFNTDKWKRIFETTRNIYMVPGNDRDPAPARDAFTKNKSVAMLGTVNIINTLGDATKQGLNWDVTQYPSYKEQPNTYGAVDGHWMFPVKTGKNKDAVIKVIEAVTSDAVQLISAKQTGRLTPLKNEEIKKSLAADLEYVKGKNIPGIFTSKPAKYVKPPLYMGNGGKYRDDAFNEYLEGNKDINTILREAEEKHNKDISTEKMK